jgi:hypothetical protein
MASEHHPLSELVGQGWEVEAFSTTTDGLTYSHHFLLKRQRQHKVLMVWRKALGGGVGFKELEV